MADGRDHRGIFVFKNNTDSAATPMAAENFSCIGRTASAISEGLPSWSPASSSGARQIVATSKGATYCREPAGRPHLGGCRRRPPARPIINTRTSRTPTPSTTAASCHRRRLQHEQRRPTCSRSARRPRPEDDGGGRDLRLTLDTHPGDPRRQPRSHGRRRLVRWPRGRGLGTRHPDGVSRTGAGVHRHQGIDDPVTKRGSSTCGTHLACRRGRRPRAGSIARSTGRSNTPSPVVCRAPLPCRSTTPPRPARPRLPRRQSRPWRLQPAPAARAGGAGRHRCRDPGQRCPAADDRAPSSETSSLPSSTARLHRRLGSTSEAQRPGAADGPVQDPFLTVGSLASTGSSRHPIAGLRSRHLAVRAGYRTGVGQFRRRSGYRWAAVVPPTRRLLVHTSSCCHRPGRAAPLSGCGGGLVRHAARVEFVGRRRAGGIRSRAMPRPRRRSPSPDASFKALRPSGTRSSGATAPGTRDKRCRHRRVRRLVNGTDGRKDRQQLGRRPASTSATPDQLLAGHPPRSSARRSAHVLSAAPADRSARRRQQPAGHQGRRGTLIMVYDVVKKIALPGRGQRRRSPTHCPSLVGTRRARRRRSRCRASDRRAKLVIKPPVEGHRREGQDKPETTRRDLHRGIVAQRQELRLQPTTAQFEFSVGGKGHLRLGQGRARPARRIPAAADRPRPRGYGERPPRHQGHDTLVFVVDIPPLTSSTSESWRPHPGESEMPLT